MTEHQRHQQLARSMRHHGPASGAQRLDVDANAKFFVQFAPQTSRQSLTRLALTARKFPQPAMLAVQRPPLHQNAASGVHQRSRRNNRQFLIHIFDSVHRQFVNLNCGKRQAQEHKYQGWMTTMLKLITKLRADYRGATAVEYGLIVSLIFLASVGAMQAFGDGAMGMWDDISTNVLGN
jgi:pilus assembly protein Flp/PilA